MSGSFKFNCTPDSAPKNPTPITPVTNGYSVLMPTLAATKNTCLKSPIKCWTSATPESAHRSYGGKRGEKDGHDIGPTRNSIKKTDRTPTIKAAKLTSKGSSHYDDTSKIASSTNSTPSVQGYSECTPHKSPKSVKPFKSKSADYIRPEVTIPQKSKSADAILRVPKEASKHEETKGEVKPPSSSVIAQCRKLIEESKKPCPPEPSQPVNIPQVCAPTKSESDMKSSKTRCKREETKGEEKPPSSSVIAQCRKLIEESKKPCPPEPSQPVNVPQVCAPTKSESDMKSSKTRCKREETKGEEKPPSSSVIAQCRKLIEESKKPCPPEPSQPVNVPQVCAPTKSESDMKSSKTRCKREETKGEEKPPSSSVIAQCRKLIEESKKPCPPEPSQPVNVPQVCAPTKSESDMKSSKTRCKREETKGEEKPPSSSVIAQCRKLIEESKKPCPPEPSQPVNVPQVCAPTKSESDMKSSKTRCKREETKGEEKQPSSSVIAQCRKLIEESKKPCPPEPSQPVNVPQVCAPTKSESCMETSQASSKRDDNADEGNLPKSLSLEECQKLINEPLKQCDSEPAQPENVPTKSESCMETSQASSKRNEDNLSKPLSLEECQKLINEPLKQCDSEPAQPENVPTKSESCMETSQASSKRNDDNLSKPLSLEECQKLINEPLKQCDSEPAQPENVPTKSESCMETSQASSKRNDDNLSKPLSLEECQKLINEPLKQCDSEPAQPENVPTKSESCMETSQASSKQNEDNLSKPLSLEECQKLINEPLKQCDSEPAQPENVPTKSESCMETSQASSKQNEDNLSKPLSLEECQKLINEPLKQCDSEPAQPENVPTKSESCMETSQASSKQNEDNLSKPLSLEECQKLINEPLKQCDSEPAQPENVQEMDVPTKIQSSTEGDDINDLVASPDSERDHLAPNLDGADTHSPSPGKSNLTILPVNSQTPRQMSPIGHPHLDNQQDKITISINCSISEKINSVHLHYEGPKSAQREERNEEDTSVETDVLSVEYTERSKELRWGVEHRLRQESEELVNMTDEDESISNIDK